MTHYVLLKRDLYECPGHQGYTGIRDKAGRWLAEEFANHGIPIKEKYTPKERDSYAISADVAPEFTNECFHDLSLAHLRGKVERLQEALTPSGATKAAYHGEFKFEQTGVDEDGDEYTYSTYVPWTTVKEIMGAIRERAEMKGAA